MKLLKYIVIYKLRKMRYQSPKDISYVEFFLQSTASFHWLLSIMLFYYSMSYLVRVQILTSARGIYFASLTAPVTYYVYNNCRWLKNQIIKACFLFGNWKLYVWLNLINLYQVSHISLYFDHLFLDFNSFIFIYLLFLCW